MPPFMHYDKRIKKRQIRRLKNAVLDQINVKQIAALASEHVFIIHILFSHKEI